MGGALPAGYGGAAALEERLTRLLARGGRAEIIGRSHRGREIFAFAWTIEGRAAAAPAPAPRILLLSLLHPMEWIGLETHLALLEDWLDPHPGPVAPLPAGTQLISVPVVNADGFARVEAALRARARRWIRGNERHVDLNRNFPVGHRTRPGWTGWWPLYRPGPAPLSEPETRAVADLARRMRPTVALSLHSFGRRVFYPAARQWRPSAGTPAHAARARAAVAGTAYRAGQLGRWSPFFRAGGSEIDFLHEEVGALAFLVEISSGGFGRWGPAHWRPFYLFNPPDPARELAGVLPVLARLALG